MKAFTDLEQSNKLAEFLPPESADMYYDVDSYGVRTAPEVLTASIVRKKDIPCWSFAALLNVISKYSSRLEIILRVDKKYNIFANFDDFVVFRKFVDIDNAIDVCMELIETLHEQKLL